MSHDGQIDNDNNNNSNTNDNDNNIGVTPIQVVNPNELYALLNPSAAHRQIINGNRVSSSSSSLRVQFADTNNHYGSTDRNDNSDIQQPSTTNESESESESNDNDSLTTSLTSAAIFSSPNRRMRIFALRVQTHVMTELSFLHRKYLDRFLICSYFTLLIGISPLTVYLYLTSTKFSMLYLSNSKIVHVIIQLVNIIVLYLFISSAFNLQTLFMSIGMNSLIGNLLIAVCSGCLLALECVDRIAIYMNEAHYDRNGYFVPTPGTDSVVGSALTPDSPVLIVMLVVSLFALLTAIVNFMHVMYYAVQYRRAVSRMRQHIENGEPVFFDEQQEQEEV